MKKNVFLPIFILTFILTFLVAGCGSQEGPASMAPVSEEGRNYDFVFVCPIIDNEYWEACMKGIRRADEELGTHTRVTGPHDAANFDVEIVGYMDEAVASKPDGIIAYAGIQDMFPLINQAGEEGIPLIAIDSDAPGTTRVAYVGTDSYNSGYQAGEAMVQLTGGEAKLGVLVSSYSAEKEMEVLDAFRDSIADYHMEIIAMEETDGVLNMAVEKTKTMLSEHPEITAMFNTGGYNVTSAARVKEEQGLDSLILMGFDDMEENLSYVRKGTIDTLIVQNPEQMGYQGIYLLKEYVDKGRLAYDSYDTRTILVTQENVDSYKD